MKNVLTAIGGFFSKIFKAAFGGGNTVLVQLPSDLQITPNLIDHCINTVNIIKNIVNNPITVLVTDLTPIALVNTIRLKISDSLPAILAGLTYEKDLLTNTPDPNDFVNTVLAKVRLSDDPQKDKFYHNLCADLIMVVSDGKVTWSEAVSVLEIYFKQIFNVPDAVPVSPAPVATPALQNAISVIADVTASKAVEGAAPVVSEVAQVVGDVVPGIAGITNVVADVAQAVEKPAVTLPNLSPEQIAAIVAANTPKAVAQ